MEQKPKYEITKEHCQTTIHGVCNGCGGKIEPIETVDNAGSPTFWPGCNNCHKFCYGVSEEVFRIARKLVCERHERYYHEPEPSDPEKRKYWIESQTSGMCSIVSFVLSLSSPDTGKGEETRVQCEQCNGTGSTPSILEGNQSANFDECDACDGTGVTVSSPRLPEQGEETNKMIAAAIAHRACHSAEHDPENGKIHGYCIVCGVPWPCDTARSFLSAPPVGLPTDEEIDEAAKYHSDRETKEGIEARFSYVCGMKEMRSKWLRSRVFPTELEGENRVELALKITKLCKLYEEGSVPDDIGMTIMDMVYHP
jgi:hypothetical protein